MTWTTSRCREMSRRPAQSSGSAVRDTDGPLVGTAPNLSVSRHASAQPGLKPSRPTKSPPQAGHGRGLVYNDPMTITEDIATMKQLPVFQAGRCKRCGICKHFCSAQAIELSEDGMPYLAKPKACTSCGLCRDMCPDWAVHLRETSVGETEDRRTSRLKRSPCRT